MTLHYVKNPMYALCLLAAICVRQHVHNNRVDKPLTKGVSFKTPTSGLTKPNEASLKAATNLNKKPDNHNHAKGDHKDWNNAQTQDQSKPENKEKTKTGKRKQTPAEQGDCLVQCVKNFAKHAQRIVDELKSGIPTPKSTEQDNSAASSGILDSLLFLTSSVGFKWLA